jgi:glutaconate CoA-transferase subunit A
MPARCMLGTDTFEQSAAIEIECPFTGQTLVALPAVYPDVALIHVHESDCYGNCRIRGITIADLDLARASKHLIITAERLVPNDQIRSAPNQTVIPSFCVDAVCEVPYGSYPGNMQGEYYSDDEHLFRWLEAEKDEAGFKAFLDEYIYGVADFAGYLQLCGGIGRMKQLRAQELLLPARE